MYTVKRYALLLAPDKDFIDWVNYIFPETPKMDPLNPLDHDNSNIYLIPDFYSPAEAMEWLEQNFDNFFQLELWNWCIDPKLWPENRTWELFQKWLHISLQSCLYDTVEGVIPKEER